VRGEGVGEAALGWEPVKFLGFGNSDVRQQQTWDVAIRKATLLRISAKELVYTLFYSKIYYYAYANPTAAAN